MKVNALRINLKTPLLALMLGLSACSLHDSQVNSNVPLGKPAFTFDPKQTSFLAIAKADPRTGDHWSARVERVPVTPGIFHDSDAWQITSYSDSSSLTDRLANRGWILHFLDTLATFRADTQMDASYSSESSAKYGFSPPRYSILWQTLPPPEAAASAEAKPKVQSYELQIGSAVDFEKNPDGETFALFPPSKNFYQANGAALVMLNYLKSFSSLRLETLSTLESDDVDELKVSGRGNTLYAQREGAQWNDRKHHSLKEVIDVDGLLNLITHLRISRFIDDSAERQKLLPEIQKSPASIKVVLKDRYAQAVNIQVSKIANHTYAIESSRPGAVFELYPESYDRLSAL